MPLNKDDSSKLNYKARIEWYRERVASLSKGFVNPSVLVKELDPEQYRQDLKDIRTKIGKLDKRIDTVCAGLKIPIDATKDPDIAIAVNKIDPSSGGEYLSYEVYKRLSEQLYAGKANLKIDDLIKNSSNDIFSNSQLIQDRLYKGYASYETEGNSGISSTDRNVNKYLNLAIDWNEWDYPVRQILDFADAYLGNYTDTDYIPWAFKQDMLFEQLQNDGLQNLWNNFSELGKVQLDNLGNIFQNLSPLQPDKNIAAVTERYLDYTNVFLNGVNDLLNEGWLADLICCFVKFTTKLDIRTLQALRTLLQLLKNSLNTDLQDIMNVFKDIFNNILRGLILNGLLGLINQIMQRLVGPIEDWLSRSDSKAWQKIFECPPLEQLMHRYIEDAIGATYKVFEELLLEIYKDLEMQKIYKDSKLFQSGENKWINTAINILDTVIAVTELAASCATENTPNAEDVQKMIDQFDIGNNDYTYPVDGTPNIYNSFITKDQQKEIEAAVFAGDSSAPSRVTNQNLTVKRAEISKRVDDCKKNIKDIDMPQSVVWFE